ncbi:hypothetical protein KGP95_13305 [Burkholderia multivorans]|uniref:hypothetical protein n=1 Tax=Burkholderia multivorans TaxID=87883 RepID=UPI0020A1FEBD|nr:hypothetical protein [Burkholderia multivorans]MCO8609682.1 hypothetical protein [Burkholderia multivorans]MCO8638307.1 hypothetical protein [Burkholderia multivorans]MCO8644531.1 hypothetical protein [Burkholderia multivorans]
MPGKLTDEQSAILIASAHRLDEVSSRYLAEELRSVLRELLAPTQQPEPRTEVKPVKIERHSDMSVLVVFRSCRQASVFEKEIAARTGASS